MVCALYAFRWLAKPLGSYHALVNSTCVRPTGCQQPTNVIFTAPKPQAGEVHLSNDPGGESCKLSCRKACLEESDRDQIAGCLLRRWREALVWPGGGGGLWQSEEHLAPRMDRSGDKHPTYSWLISWFTTRRDKS